MKAILMKIDEYFNSLDLIDYGTIVVLILLILVCCYVYYDSKKLDKSLDDDIDYIEKRYGRSK